MNQSTQEVFDEAVMRARFPVGTRVRRTTSWPIRREISGTVSGYVDQLPGCGPCIRVLWDGQKSSVPIVATLIEVIP